LSIPGLPGVKKGYAHIQTTKHADIEYIESYFPLEQWTDAYAHNKWRSYVYAPREVANEVRDVAISVLRQQSNLAVTAAVSNQTCHL
jgi:hypothetical protein